MNLPLDQRPVIVAVAGPNGAGKTTFYYSHLQPAGPRLVNADTLAQGRRVRIQIGPLRLKTSSLDTPNILRTGFVEALSLDLAGSGGARSGFMELGHQSVWA
jgi:ATPase subunit of ABC transporter with duplicated ATPase domains